jgi:hypothetical protein
LRRRHVRRLHGRKDLQRRWGLRGRAHLQGRQRRRQNLPMIRGARLERAARNYW